MSEIAESSVDLPPEQQAIRAKCFHPSGIFAEFKKEEIEQSIPDRFEKIARQYPDRLAVKTESHGFTYGELNKMANRVARAIVAKQGQGQEPVLLLFEQGIQAISAILGALKAGKFYVPVDPSYPPDRIASILEDSGARLIVTDGQNFSRASEWTDNRFQLLEVDTIDAHVPADNLCFSLSPTAYAYIMYTSGSTGQPKGVVQDHRGILHKAMLYANNLHVCLNDRLTLLHSTSFGACTHHLFGSLLNGASLFPFNARMEAGPQLAKWLITEQITIYHSVPTVFRQMIGALTGEEEFPNLRVINVSGAPMMKEDVKLYQRHFSSECILVQMMGATETGYIRGYFMNRETQIGGSRVPVGYAAEDKEVILLGDDGQEIGCNEIGEIAVRSRYLAPGYWRKPKLTRTKFVPDPEGGDEPVYLTGDRGLMHPDGCLVHLGRKDFQIKIRGHRIEVSEIEMALTDLDTIQEAIVVVREDRAGDQQLVAYLVAAGQPAPAISELRNFLKKKLPDYMIPSIFVMLGALPLTPTGKVDRLALPAPGGTRPELDTPFAAPRTAVEEELAKIWAEVLSLDQVGIHDSFFELGGHSLAATRVISRVVKRFHSELPIKSLFQAPTVAEMAVAITQSQPKKLVDEDLTRMLGELDSLSDDEAKRLIEQEMEKSTRVKHP